MPQSEHFDVLALGSGVGGKLIAWQRGVAGCRDRARSTVCEVAGVGGAVIRA